MDLHSIVALAPWTVLAGVVGSVLGVLAPVAGKVIITALALRGTNPKERPSIIRAVAELFWRRP